MVLEAVMFVFDNSEWMRNGDYTPNRMESCKDSLLYLAKRKLDGNQETTVGVMSGAGSTPEVQVTLTNDQGKILSSISSIKVKGEFHFTQSVQIAQLAVKHRQNKTQHQRIIMCLGSPLKEEEKPLIMLAKRLKKNNVAMDIINISNDEQTEKKLTAFRDNINSKEDPSTLLTIPPGSHYIPEILGRSAILKEGATGDPLVAPTGSGGSGEDAFAEYGGIDPSVDPELAMVMKMSLMEQKSREQTETPKPDQPQNSQTGAATNNPPELEMDDDMDPELLEALKMSVQPQSEQSKTDEKKPEEKKPEEKKPEEKKPEEKKPEEKKPESAIPPELEMDDDMDPELLEALKMSVQPQSEQSKTEGKKPEEKQAQDSIPSELLTDDMDPELRLALELSMKPQSEQSNSEPQKDVPKTTSEVDTTSVMQDSDFLQSVLSTLPDVDLNDERIQGALSEMTKKDDEKKDDDKKDDMDVVKKDEEKK